MCQFENGSRVCFVGDSITHQNIYLSHIVAYYREKFPNLDIEFYNCGISGATLDITLNVFEKDIMTYNPTHIVLTIGANDSHSWLLNNIDEKKYDMLCEAFEAYKSNVKKFADMLKERNIKLTLCTPPPMAEYCKNDGTPQFHYGSYALMLGYADFIRSFAKENGYPLCDYHSYLARILIKEDVYADLIHPSPRGYYYMAKCFLAFQGYDIGEEKEIPDYLSEWVKRIAIIRATYAAVSLVLGTKNATREEKLAAMEAYIKREDTNASIVKYAKIYIAESDNLDSHVEWVKAFMKSLNKK